MSKILAGVGVAAVGAVLLLFGGRSTEAAPAPGSYCHGHTVGVAASRAEYYQHVYYEGDWWVLTDADAAACTDVNLTIPQRANGKLLVCRAGVVTELTYAGGFVNGLQAGDTYIFSLAALAACTPPV